jgi:hypothetical protein
MRPLGLVAMLAMLLAGCGTLQRIGALAEHGPLGSAGPVPSAPALQAMTLRSPDDGGTLPIRRIR